MTWKVRFRGKDWTLTSLASDDEAGVQKALTGQTDEPGSFAIEFPLDPEDDERFVDIIITHSVSPEEYPYRAIHGNHPDYGDIYMMSGLEKGIIIYGGDVGAPASNEEPFTGDGI